jgi:hypothetical protein
MRALALGFKSHSGWAALVTLDDSLAVIERRRIELVDPEHLGWAKQPYHAAETLEAAAARRLIERAIGAAQRTCLRQMRAICDGVRDSGYAIRGCGIVGNENLPDWSVEQILAVHMRMHKAEGVLFPAALKQAAAACGVPVSVTSEAALQLRTLQDSEFGARALQLALRGKSIGAPWGKDQKSAALAALSVLLG